MLVRKNHTEYAEILLFDGHGEYGFGTNETTNTDRATWVWDPFELNTLLMDEGDSPTTVNGQTRSSLAYDLLFADLHCYDGRKFQEWEHYADAREWGHTLLLRGDEELLAKAFYHLRDELTAIAFWVDHWGQYHRPGALEPTVQGDLTPVYVPTGDDDTFDYWPSAMEMLFELGEDLWLAFGTRVYMLDAFIAFDVAADRMKQKDGGDEDSGDWWNDKDFVPQAYEIIRQDH